MPDKNSYLGPYGPIYETSVVKFLHICFYAVIFSIYVFMLLLYFSDRQLLKIENENNMKTDHRSLIYGTRIPLAQVYIGTNS